MQRILITGPESTGKSTLATQLADKHQCLWVPEFARNFLYALTRPYEETDLIPLLIGQIDAEEAAKRTYPTAPYLFCDTGPEVLYIWSKWKYGRVAKPIEQALLTHIYDRRLLCYPDLAWEADPLREASDIKERLRLFAAYESLFKHYKLQYEIVRGERSDFVLVVR